MNGDYLAGKKVYKGGLPNAQSGTLNPTGYIERGMKQQSERRSGLAQNALNNLRGNQQDAEQQQLYPTNPVLRRVGLVADDTGRIRSVE